MRGVAFVVKPDEDPGDVEEEEEDGGPASSFEYRFAPPCMLRKSSKTIVVLGPTMPSISRGLRWSWVSRTEHGIASG
jgi:hypothetical protein